MTILSKGAAQESLEFFDALESLAMRLQHSQRDLFRDAKLTPLHFYILRWLAKQKAINAAAIAKVVGIRPQTMTPIVDALEDGGLIRRVPSPVDRRATLLVLTPRGARQIRMVRAAQLDLVERALRNLPAGEITAATRALVSLRDSLPHA